MKISKRRRQGNNTGTKKQRNYSEHWQNISRNDQEDEFFESGNIQKVERRIFSHTPDLSPYSFGDLTRLNNEIPPIILTELKQIIKNGNTMTLPNQNNRGTFETFSHQHTQLPTL